MRVETQTSFIKITQLNSLIPAQAGIQAIIRSFSKFDLAPAADSAWIPDQVRDERGWVIGASPEFRISLMHWTQLRLSTLQLRDTHLQFCN